MKYSLDSYRYFQLFEMSNLTGSKPGKATNDECVSFMTRCDNIITAPYHFVAKNPVLRMLYQYRTSTETPPVILVDEESAIFVNLLRYLQGNDLPLHEWEVNELLTNLRCAHKYQEYAMAICILQPLMNLCRSHNVLHIYTELFTFPEMPPLLNPSAPSAPPIHDLNDSDPALTSFATALGHAGKQCLKMIDEQTVEVLASDALLSLTAPQLAVLACRDTLSARELEIGRALLRWCRHHSLHSALRPEERRELVLGNLRLLTMKPRDLRRLELQRDGVVSAAELEVLLELVQHGNGQLTESLEEFSDQWLQKRSGPTSLARRGILQCLTERSRSKSLPSSNQLSSSRRVRFQGSEEVVGEMYDDVVEDARHQESLERRRKRTEKIKLALATGASLLFD